MEVRNCDWEMGTERQLELKYCLSALAWQPRLPVVLMWPRGTSTATPPPAQKDQVQCLISRLYPYIVLSSALTTLMPRIQNTTRLYKEHFDFLFCEWFVLYALRNDVHFAFC